MQVTQASIIVVVEEEEEDSISEDKTLLVYKHLPRFLLTAVCGNNVVRTPTTRARDRRE